MIDGNLEVIQFKGEKPDFQDGKILLKPGTKVVSYETDRNKIMLEGRKAIAGMTSGKRPFATVSYIEMGVGGYGIGNTIDPKLQPPPADGSEIGLSIPTNPVTKYTIDPEIGIVIPEFDPTANVYIVSVDNFVKNFNEDLYYGITELGLFFGEVTDTNGTVWPPVMLAKKNRRPILVDDDSILVIRWTVRF
jgi:hypothetical protein